MKDWPWQKWVGKLLLLVVGIGELVIESLEITNVGFWPTIVTLLMWLGQFIISGTLVVLNQQQISVYSQ